MDTGAIFLVVGVWAVGIIVGCTALYWIIRQAVLHALRDHTMSSRTAVAIVTSVPLEVVPATTPQQP